MLLGITGATGFIGTRVIDIALGRGNYARCIELLSTLPPRAHRIGGSHAQRDVLYLTLLSAVERLRRPRLRVAA